MNQYAASPAASATKKKSNVARALFMRGAHFDPSRARLSERVIERVAKPKECHQAHQQPQIRPSIETGDLLGGTRRSTQPNRNNEKKRADHGRTNEPDIRAGLTEAANDPAGEHELIKEQRRHLAALRNVPSRHRDHRSSNQDDRSRWRRCKFWELRHLRTHSIAAPGAATWHFIL